MVTKLADVYANVNTEKNVFYSAYMKGKIQYNDVDPNKLVSSSELLENGEYNLVPGVTPPVEEDIKQEEEEEIESEEEEIEEEIEEEEEDSKIIVTIHDINSPKSSSNNLQSFNENE